MAPREKAFPMETFFLIHISTRIKTMQTRIMAGICSIIVMRQFYTRIFSPENTGNHMIEPCRGSYFDFVLDMNLYFFKTICFEVFSIPVRIEDTSVHSDVCAVRKDLNSSNCSAYIENRI
jgi:hypothetical protein